MIPIPFIYFLFSLFFLFLKAIYIIYIYMYICISPFIQLHCIVFLSYLLFIWWFPTVGETFEINKPDVNCSLFPSPWSSYWKCTAVRSLMLLTIYKDFVTPFINIRILHQSVAEGDTKMFPKSVYFSKDTSLIR